MTRLWPRLPQDSADRIFNAIEASSATPRAATSHPDQVFAQVGGVATESDLDSIRDSVLAIASQFGFPGRPPTQSERQDFDRAVAVVLFETMPMTWSEAGSRDVWSFTSLVLLPDVTEWRWQGQGSRNRERWIATDLTRHTWSRAWWLIAAFDLDLSLASSFQESELNQLLERRSIGGNPPLLASLARSILKANGVGISRRELIRDVTRRLRRQLAFVNASDLSGAELAIWTDVLVAESATQLVARRDAP